MKLATRIFKREDWKFTSPFGDRIHPVTKVKSFHSGTDYGSHGEKWKQYALEEGIVLAAGVDSGGYGALFAWVSYPRLGIKCLHYHLDAVFVKKGQKVTTDTCIGTTGTSGRSTGIHLHLGVKHLNDNKYFDPESFDYQPINNEGHVETPLQTLEIKAGDKVKITGKQYATGQTVPFSVRLKTHTVQRINKDKALLKEIISWVYLKDLTK